GDLGGAVDPRPRALRRRATDRARARAGLARAIPRGAGPSARGHRPRRHLAARPARGRPRAQPAPAHRLVRAPRAAPPRRTPGTPHVTVASRIVRSLVVLGVLLVVAFGAIAPPERCPRVTGADLQRSRSEER